MRFRVISPAAAHSETPGQQAEADLCKLAPVSIEEKLDWRGVRANI